MALFNREEEVDALRRRFESRKSFLLHGPSGVGKTHLLECVKPEFPNVLYCSQSSSPQAVFRALAEALIQQKDAAVLHAMGRRSVEAITAVSLKGIITRILRGSRYVIVLDHLNRPGHSLAAAIRELMISCSVPVIAVARSAHMEDAGFVAPMFPDRGDKLVIKNFGPDIAESFIRALAAEQNLVVENFNEFVSKVVEFSDGNPGAIVKIARMAGMSKYRFGGHVKLSPLYIDFRLELASANSE